MRTILVVGAILGLLLAAAPAHAAFQLSLDDGAGHSVLITDDLAGDAAAPQLGSISATLLNVGTWQVTVTAAVSKPLDGSISEPVIDLTVMAVSSAAGGTLTIMASDTDFGPISPSLDADKVSAGVVVASGGSVDVYGWFDTTNTAFGTESPIPSLLDLGPGAVSATATGAVPPAIVGGANPFSMTLAVSITHTGHGTSSVNARNDPMPEPATLAIWSLLGLAGVMVSRRRRTLA